MLLSSTLRRSTARQQIWKNIIQQILIKNGAWLWVISPLPYAGRTVMVVGIDACKQSKESPCIQVLCASTNPYFTTYHTTWRVRKGGDGTDHVAPPGDLLREAMLTFFRENRRLPDTLVVYRGGVSESQEALLIENELYNPEGGLLETLVVVSGEVDMREEDVLAWKERFEMCYILVRRGTNARFKTAHGENLPSGTHIDDRSVFSPDVSGHSKRLDFYMISQTYVIGTAKPTLYSVLYSTLTLSTQNIIQLTYRLCGVYATFSGMVSMPAPLKYAAKLVSLLSKCEHVPAEPTQASAEWKPLLFFL